MKKKKKKTSVDIPQIVKVIGEYEGFKIGDRVKVIDEWAKGLGSHYAYVRGFQKNYNIIFIIVEWAGTKSLELEEKYGKLFDTKSLKKIG